MTRDEFINEVNCWSELLDWCYDYDCSYCEDVYTEDSKDGYFDDDLVDMARNAGSWRDMLDELNDIPTGYDYYIRNDYGEWRGADDDDFDSYKDDILEWGDDNDVWDEDEEEDEEYACDESESDDDDGFEIEEGCSLNELFTSCTSNLQRIEQQEEQAQEQESRSFEALIAG